MELEICSIGIPSIYIYLRSYSNLLICINPRFLVREIHFYSSSIMDYLPSQRMSRQEHPHFYRNRRWWIEEVIHNGSCPSSRTLLSTTSFQTKFYHNIPRICNQYGIDSIMESWIVIGSISASTLNLYPFFVYLIDILSSIYKIYISMIYKFYLYNINIYRDGARYILFF